MRTATINQDAISFAARHQAMAGSLFSISALSAESVESLVDQKTADGALNLVNSGYFGLSRNAKSLSHAHELMGGELLSRAALAAWAFDLLSAPVPGYDLPAGDLWRHALGVSIAAENLSETLKISGSKGVEWAFLAGVFHDIGKLILGPYVASASDEIEQHTESGMSFEAAETAVLGVDHAAVGSRILSVWDFPDELIQAVLWSHVPDRAAVPSVLTDLLHVSNVLCVSVGIGMGKEGLKYKASPAAAKRINATTEKLELAASHALQWINDLSDLPAGL